VNRLVFRLGVWSIGLLFGLFVLLFKAEQTNKHMNTIIHTRDTVPAWYQFGFDEGAMSIIIKIHALAVHYIEHLEGWDKALPFYGNRCSGEFSLFKDSRFGFGGVFKVTREDDWNVLKAVLPVMYSEGKPHSSEGYEKNLWMSLAALFNLMLPMFDRKTDSRTPQHIVMGNIGIESRRGKAGISLIFTPHMARWLSIHSDGEIVEVSRMMKAAYNFMWRKDSSSRDCMSRVERRDDGTCLTLSVPGDGCWVSGGRSSCGQGFRLDSHNVDSFLQLLTFLVGFCKLHELALSGTELPDSFF
jgi:hypothetical protein